MGKLLDTFEWPMSALTQCLRPSESSTWLVTSHCDDRKTYKVCTVHAQGFTDSCQDS